MRVYLAGPLQGCTPEGQSLWRDEVTAKLKERGIEVSDPFRAETMHSGNVKAIVEGDKAAVEGSDYVLAFCWKPSTGTAMEILHAYLKGVPVLVVVPTDQKVNPWLRYHAYILYSTIDEAVAHLSHWVHHPPLCKQPMTTE
jgi:nucleoside 2-deoxyribosyltransferase